MKIQLAKIGGNCWKYRFTFKKFWSKQLRYIGFHRYHIILDFRKGSIQDMLRGPNDRK